MQDTADIENLVSQQKEFFRNGNTRCLKDRLLKLSALEQSIIAHQEAILNALRKDLGKPSLEAYLAEYYFVLQEIRLVRKNLKKWLKPEKASNPIYFLPCRSEIRREPFGVAVIFSPWNYPLQLALSPFISAIAAGNTAIIKPSEDTPHASVLLEKIVSEVFPPEWATVIQGDASVASALLDQPSDFIFFTGSTSVGKMVGAKAGGSLIPHVLELGGKCPCIVDATADIELTAKRILIGKFFNGGQTCFAPDYVVVHSSLKQALVDAMSALLRDVPWNEDLAHIVNDRHFDRVSQLISSDCIQAHANDHPLSLPPTLLPNCDWNSSAMLEEIFGPVLPILTYDNDEELIEELEPLGSPLTLYLFSNDTAWNEKMQTRLRSGAVCINDTMKQGSHLGLPFGGVGESGYGRYRGKTGVETFTYQRPIVRRYKKSFFDLIPPYGDKIDLFKKYMR